MKGQTILFLINTISGMGYSIIAPLFPLLNKNHGINEELIGWMISTYSITSTIITPLVPLFCKKMSRIKLLYIATFFEATCTLLYGFLNYLSSFYLLVIIIFILRILHGIGAGIIATLIYSLTCSLSSEEDLQVSLGNLELGWSLGISSGPLCASIFYKIGGFSLPFIVLGFILYISVYLTSLIKFDEKKDEEEIEDNPPFMKFVIYPEILIIIIALVLGMISCSYYFPSLTNHLINKYNLSVSTSSLFFVIPVIFYAIGIQFLDCLTKMIGVYTIISIGYFLVSISSLFTYPNYPLPNNIFFVLFGFVLKGFGSGPLFVTSIIVFSKTISRVDKNIDDLTANDIASAIINSAFNIGDFTGPIIGGFLSNRFGFYYSCFIVALFCLFYAVFFVFYFFENIRNDLKEKNIENGNGDGNNNLLNNNENKDENNNNLNNSFNHGNTYLNGLRVEFFGRKKINYWSFNKRKERSSKISLYSSLTN